MTKVVIRRSGNISILAISHPPVNALSISAGVVDALSQAFEAEACDPAVPVIVLAGEGRMFSGGADIGDFEHDQSLLNTFRELLVRIETAQKPVIAAIHGMALGGGLELALAAHYRIAARGTKLGLPEVALGLLPGAGGTQRLPRLMPVDAAIAMMVAGKPIGVEQALVSGLVDEVVDGADAQAAIAAAVEFVERSAPLSVRPTGQRPVNGDGAEAVAAARRNLKAGSLSWAPAAIIDCVEAATRMPFSEGLRFEKEAFEALINSEASLGLRHVFFGERQVARIPGMPRDMATREIGSAAVVGAGTMGTGIVTALLAAGLRVVLVEAQESALARSEAAIRKTFARDVEKGRLTADAAAQRIGQLKTVGDLEAVADADLVIEAVYEDMGVKEQVFTALDRLAKPGAILASNTSTLDVDVIARFTRRPADVVGLHFFSPANIMRLLEVVRGAQTSPEVLATAMAFARRIGKVGVVAGVCDGFVGNRIFEEYLRQAYFLAEEGATPRQIDSALERWGWAMGPFRTLDLAGQDIAHAIRQRRAVDQPDRPYSRFLDKVVALGRYGQKTGRGIYNYPDGRTAEVDPAMDDLLLRHSADEGIARRAISDAEIVERCLLAMINEGAKVIEEGIAYRPVDIDIIYVNGYGFSPERGGPMFHADRLGLAAVVQKLEALAAQRHGWAFAPADLIRRLVDQNQPMASLNR